MILNFLVLNVSSRTCICAAFNPDKCSSDTNCEWNNDLPTTGITRGFHGICRTIRFMECKRNPDCTLKNKDPREYDNGYNNDDLDIKVVKSHGTDPDDNDQTNGNDPTPKGAGYYNWPFNCYEIGIEIEAEIEVNERIENDNMMIKSQGEIKATPKSVYESMSALQIGAGIVFIFLLVSAMIYWQCNKEKMEKDDDEYRCLTGNGNKYSTFNDV